MRKKISIGLALLMVINMMLVALGSAAPATSFAVTSMLPAGGAKGVPLETKTIQLLFDRDVKAGTGTIEVIAEEIGKPGLVTTVLTQTVSPQGYVTKRLDLTLPDNNHLGTGTPLIPNAVYHVKGTAGAFIDAGNPGTASEAFDLVFTSLSAPGSKPPAISAVNPFLPATGATVTGTDEVFSLTFDKPILKGNGNIYVKRASNNDSVLALSVQDAGVLINDKTVSWQVSNLVKGDRYYVLVDQGAFVDIDNQPSEGISNAQRWFVNVKGNPVEWHTKTPTVPANSAVNVGINDTIQLNFTRPVYPDRGTIELQLTAPSNGTPALVKAFEVTSSEVKGGGTSQITITLPQMNYNTGYKVSVPARAFIDSDNNDTEIREWSFTTGAAASGTLKINSLSPSDRSSGNAVTSKMVAAFNNPIIDKDLSKVSLKKQGNTGVVPAAVSVSGRQLIVTPSSNLQEGATYYVDIAAGAVADSVTGAPFDGLSGSSSWTFQTLTSDRTAPVLQSAVMYSNSVIRLSYNKTLNASINLLTSSFSATVNGETRRISNAYASGESVYVTLETGVAVGQNVRISYSGSSIRPIQDTSGNAAGSISSKDVTNGIDSVLPKPKDGSVSGRSLTLYFSDTLKSVSTYAYDQFRVTADGYSKGVDSIYQSGSTVTLYLTNSISNGEVVKVSYSPGSYPLQDYRGQNISGFDDYYVRNTYDTVAPEFTGVGGAGNKIVLSYNEALRTTPLPMKSQFSVLVNNSPVYVTAVEIVSNQVILTLASSFTKEQAVTLSYVSGSGGISDLNGNLAGYINLQPVNYNVITEGIRSAVIQGDTITITYNTSLRTVSSFPLNQFYVTADKTSQTIQSASASGNTVIVKLANPVTSLQAIEISYMSGSTLLYDTSGNVMKGYTSMPVTNATSSSANTGIIGQPSYVSLMSAIDFGQTGYVLDTNAAQITADRSRYGQTISKYTLDSTKLKGAFDFLIDNNSSVQMLAFEVPATEKAAEVAVPMNPLMEVYSTGKTASFAVKYGNNLYVLPVQSLPYTEISRSLGNGSFSSVNLVIRLEAVSKVMLPSLPSSGAVTVSSLADPVEVYVTANSGSNQVEVAYKGQLYIKTSKQLPSVTSSLVKYDLSNRMVAYMPSAVKTSGAGVIFIAKINGNTVVGPAVGYGYFEDTANHWAKNDIAELAGKMIVDSASASKSYKFEPDKKITRAEFATFLAKGLGLPLDVTSASRFPDVTASSTTGLYIGAAAKAGIINGYPDGTFKPNNYITREQMALMMVRAMEYAGYNTSANGASTQTLTRFKDGAKIQAKDTVAIAVKEGIIQGVSANLFQPGGNATRAQAAVMLKRVLDKLNNI
ncbi:Ig-like domain-containing protein [Paenibacillus sp. Marseille-P2973]|uniref:SwmB domain-containing protein n=1 Tax=Paenibacillus sp. Marseille-P2973 TaxID=1871032 RepID=UPI001B36D6E9|nr:SwmB domain-containing protein [Paenibacillus sp. Marseille-P2973]MBQ4900034.1 Ig-like domain-containing protein [Paenibacillus sp. Marseille-P2973]